MNNNQLNKGIKCKYFFQILGIIIVIIANLQKKKSNMMLWFTVSNIVHVCTYFTFGRIASACICIIAALRTFIYFIYAYKKIKPNIYILIIFEILFVVTTILTWQNVLDLMPLFALMIAGYASWQNEEIILRIGYIINPLLFSIYNFIIGAYFSAVSEIILLISSTVGVIYYIVLKKDVSIFTFLKLLIFKKKNAKEIETTDENIENKIDEV